MSDFSLSLSNAKFHRQAFTVYKNGENLKIEIFRQEVTVSNAILAFLDHLNPIIFH